MAVDRDTRTDDDFVVFAIDRNHAALHTPGHAKDGFEISTACMDHVDALCLGVDCADDLFARVGEGLLTLGDEVQLIVGVGKAEPEILRLGGGGFDAFKEDATGKAGVDDAGGSWFDQDAQRIATLLGMDRKMDDWQGLGWRVSVRMEIPVGRGGKRVVTFLRALP